MMRIEVSNNRTNIFIKKKNEDIVRRVLDKIPALQSKIIYWSKFGCWYINEALSEEMLTQIRNEHYKLFESPKIVRGYKGCPITSYDFAWKI